MGVTKQTVNHIIPEKPPTTDRGVVDSQLTIDWVSFSFPISKRRGLKEGLKRFENIIGADITHQKRIAARKGFIDAIETDLGRLDYADMNGQSYCGVVLSGDTLRVLRKRSIRSIDSDEQGNLVSSITNWDGKISRIDIAIDLFKQAKVSDLITDYESGLTKTKSKTAHVSSDLVTGGKTFYLGSRTSDLFFRGYDKAVQTGSKLHPLWVRMELEIKGKTAKRVQAGIVGQGLPKVAKHLFSKYQFAVEWYQGMLSAMPDGGQIASPVISNAKQKWLTDQVLPALTKLQKSEKDVFDWFVGEVEKLASQS